MWQCVKLCSWFSLFKAVLFHAFTPATDVTTGIMFWYCVYVKKRRCIAFLWKQYPSNALGNFLKIYLKMNWLDFCGWQSTVKATEFDITFLWMQYRTSSRKIHCISHKDTPLLRSNNLTEFCCQRSSSLTSQDMFLAKT